MSKLRVMTILGTRPEIIRLSRIIYKLDGYCDHIIVHSGQNYDYELSEIFFSDLQIRKPDIFLEAAGDTAAATIGKIIIAADKVIEEFRPEAVLLLGDTNSCLAAISAKRRRVPIFHMEAGNRCFDQRVPEEINRKIIDHISDINLTYSDIAREYLLREGFPSEQIIKIGSPMREVLDFYKKDIEASNVLERLNLKKGFYFVISVHREENVESRDKILKLMNILNFLAEKYQNPIIFSTHPRTRKKIEDLNIRTNKLVQFYKPFGFLDYVNLQMHSRCVLSDSGTITEEASILNFAALNLREVNERPEGFEEGAVMMVGLNLERIVQGIGILKDREGVDIKIVENYSATNVSEKVVRVIHSYTDFINRRVWSEFA